MRKIILLAFVFVTSISAFGQDFSNKGKDFWVGYGYHTMMQPVNANSQDMVLYFATDQATNITITIPASGYTQNITTGAGNNVVTSAVIPKTGAQDARLLAGGLSNNGIHITSDKPMVAYAHIYNGSCSGATILYPTNTLGREYYSVNFKNWSNFNNANCWFYVMATDTGTTTIEITPQGNLAGVITTNGWSAGTTYTVNLTQGQIFNVMGILTGGGPPPNGNPYTGVDLTGSRVKSINNGSGCKKIAVYSGSGRISISCDLQSSSSDNYMVQAMPRNAWGKKYLTVPANGNQAFNIYRVCVSHPAAVVRINGIITGLPLINNFYYELPQTNQPLLIEADSAIIVAQYFTSQNECGNGNPGDPEVIYLSAVEQSINKVLWNATPNFAINAHYYNVVIPNTGTALSSFRLDGNPVAGWVTHPQEPNFSYLRMAVGAGPRVIQSDSGFNAIAYGFAGAESYGYNAGTNIKDLYQQIGVQTTYGIETTPSVCTNSPFKFKVSLPYIPDSMRWVFNGAAGMLPNNNTVYINNTGNVAQDSITVVNGRTLHWYSAPLQYTFTSIGVYPVNIITFAPNGECGTEQDIPFDLTVSDPPTASFTTVTPGCYLEPVVSTETTSQVPKPTYKIWWEFFDPVTNTTTVYSTTPSNSYRTVSHTFTTPGTIAAGTAKRIRYASITTPGCLSDTIVQIIELPDVPNATINGNTTVCINTGTVPVTFTGTGGTAEYIFSYNINGGATQTTTASTAGVFTINAPTNVAGTFVYNLTGVSNALPVGTPCTRAITGQSITINVTPDATVTLRAGDNDNQTVCINTPIVNIRYDVGGSGTGGTVSGLPPGVTGTYAAGVITITGTPTAPGVFGYTVTTTGPCLTPSASGTITVTDDATIALTSGAGSDNQTLCINTPLLVNITYAVGGTGTGGSVTGLPAGVTGVFAGGVITISGTPTVAGVFNYTVLTTGPCVIPTATGTITVTGDGTITLTSAAGTDNQSLCINIPITNITYAVGGTGTGGSVTGLPPGVTGVFAAGIITISGTPTSTAGSPYVYTVTTTGPCVIPTATGTITVNPDASIVLTSAAPTTSQELCRNSAITDITYAISGGGTGAGVTGLPAGVTGVFAGGIFTISGSPTVDGLFNYTVTTTGTCVQNSLSGTILVNPLPTAAFTSTAPRCETRVISFTDASTPNVGTLDQWTWDFGDASPTSTLQNPTHVYAAAGPYTVTLTVRNTKGCISNPIASTVINIDNRPQAGYIIPEVCLSDTYAQFWDTSNIAAGSIVAWEWYFDDPNATPGNPNTSTLQNPTHSYTAVGVYDSVQLIVTSAAGCRDTIIQTLVVNGSNPYAIFSVNNPATLCANDSVAIVEASTVFPGVITKIEIYWDNVNFPAVFDTDNSPFTGKVYRHLYPNFQTPLTKVFQIRYRAYSGGVCVDDSLSNITVNAAPLVQFNNMPNTCYLVPPFQITQASEIGGVPGTGTYSGPGVSPTGLFSPQVAGVGTHTILYTFTSTAAGCVDTMSNTITVLDTAHATFSVVLPACEQVPISFTDLSTAPATVTIVNTVWDFGDGTPIENHAPGSTFTHIFALPGTYNVRMYNVSAAGCLSTDTVAAITIDPNHSIALTSGNNNQSVCINTPIVPIVYTLGGGATGATVTGLPAGVNYTVTGTTLTISGTPSPLAGGPLFPFSIVTTGNTCVVANAAGSIAVQPDHTIAFNNGDTAQSVCVNTPIDPIIYDIGGGATGVTIANLPPGVTFAVVGTTVTISGSPTTTAGGPLFNYTISTTGNSCLIATAIGEIRVNPYPVPDYTVDKTSYCLPNAVVKFTNTSAMPDGSGMTYVWELGDGTLPNPTSVNVTHWYATEGPFNVKLTARSTAVLNNNVIGCVLDITKPLNTIHPQPKADFVFSKPSVCIGDNVLITDATDGKDGIVNQWNWDMGDGTTRTTNPLIHTFADTITYTITMFSINTHGCNSDTISKPFTVYPYPKVNAGPDKFVLEGGSVQLEGWAFGREPQIAWTPVEFLTDSRILQPRVVNPNTDMTYRLTVTGKGGCEFSDNVYVKLLKFPSIPNTFSPNGDGINDKWRIDYLNTYPNNRVQIFTRAGNLVFESRGYNTPWDGTLKGKPLPFDTYYYIIEPGNGRDPITGYVTILK